MDFMKFISSYRGNQHTVRILGISAVCLAVSNCLLAVSLYGHRDAVVLVPPHLGAEVKVVAGRSTESYIRAWGLFLGELVGNISPNNLRFVQDSLDPMISPKVYRQITDILNMQAEQIIADAQKFHILRQFFRNSYICIYAERPDNTDDAGG